MAVAVERERVTGFDRVVSVVFTCRIWMLTTVVLVAATAVHGCDHSTAMWSTMRVAAEPFTYHPDVGAWIYSSAFGPLLSAAVGATTAGDIARVHYIVTVAVIGASVAAIARWRDDVSARLFLLAYFCSPNSWAGTAYLGSFDIVTVGAITVAAVAPPSVALLAGLVGGVSHFEQAAIAFAVVAVIKHRFWRQSLAPMWAAAAGLVAGKLIVLGYLASIGAPSNGRLDFIRDTGLATIIDGWAPHVLTLEWAVYNVLWVGMIWMLANMHRDDRTTAIGLHLFVTLPVLITFDLSRVYRTVSWPLVLLLVAFAADHPDQRLVRRAAVLLAVAAVFVPRTELWHGGLVLN